MNQLLKTKNTESIPAESDRGIGNAKGKGRKINTCVVTVIEAEILIEKGMIWRGSEKKSKIGAIGQRTEGSSSRIWQRASYWDARPLCRSNIYPLFIPRQNFCTVGGDPSWSDRSSSNFGVASMESERKARLDTSSSGIFSYTSASPHSIETHMDLQKGISLLKKSVACVTAYCYNSLGLDVEHWTRAMFIDATKRK